jgi:hypothetical protein
MAGKMISELSDAITLQSTDLIPLARGASTLRIDGTTLVQSITSALPAGNSGTVTNVTGTAPIAVANGTTTPSISIAAATTSAAGSMSSTDKTRLDDASGVNGLVKCNGSGDFSAAVAGTDYLTSETLSGSPAAAKAWVVFNGDGTVAMQKSYKVSSVADLGVSNYRVNFDTGTMSDSNYTITGTLWDVPAGVSGDDNYASGNLYFGTNTLTPVTQTYFEFFAIGVGAGSGYDPLRITIVCHN